MVVAALDRQGDRAIDPQQVFRVIDQRGRFVLVRHEVYVHDFVGGGHQRQ